MDLRALESVVALADELHFGRAAMRLNMSQPALSQRISALEEEIGHALFLRVRGPIHPTEAGAAFVRRARVAIANADAAKSDAKLAATGSIGRLRIGFTQIVLYRSFPEMLRRFRGRFPKIETKLSEQYSPALEQALMDGRLDIALVHPPLVFKDLKFERLDDIPLVMAMPSDWPQAKEPSVRLGDCATMPFLMAPREIGPVFHDRIVAACRQAGFSPNVVQEAAPMSMLIGLASAGLGAGLVCECLSVVKPPGVSFLPVEDDLPALPIAVAWRRDNPNPAMKHFLEMAMEAGAEPAA